MGFAKWTETHWVMEKQGCAQMCLVKKKKRH